ncbi:glucose-methanol-choline oxidoreductase [Halenospora varia]|nr:glucose-methanol-choline oxidoreductase [Halenospora varia]
MVRNLSLPSLLALVATSHALPSEHIAREAETIQHHHSLSGNPKLLGSSFGVPGTDKTYDYIVVGGGNAGLTLASRLAEQQKGTVAVIEAGGFYEVGNGNISQVPAYDGTYAGRSVDDWQPMIDWGYASTPQAGAYGQRIHYARGKTLGGSTARNYMAYQRGTKASYKRWADQVGDDDYSWEKFLPYFEKSVKFTPPQMDKRFKNGTPEYDPTVLGDGTGPLSLTFSTYVQSWATWATKGLLEIGIPIVKGFQSGSLMGQSYGMFTINATTMVRDSSETSFMAKAMAYDNHIVYPSTLAKKILFDASKKATGVVVNTQGKEYTLSARKEVILSAGVFGSPQLLLVSGVGPAATLNSLNIPVVADRPGVGQNMEDHIYFGPSYRVNGITLSRLGDPVFYAQQAKEYQEKASGIFASPTTDILAWEKIPEPYRSQMSNSTLKTLAEYPADWPETEYLALGAYLGYQLNLATGDPQDGYNYASLAIALCTPRSRGNLTISSTDTSVAPLINPNWMTDQADVDVAVAGFKRARDFWNTPSMKKFTIGEEAFPGKNVTTDAQIEDIIRKTFNTIYHAACTCAMGKAENPMAVIDNKARVYGVQGLRVVDAASFPILPPGHPQSTVYALAEKIACDISGNCPAPKGHY